MIMNEFMKYIEKNFFNIEFGVFIISIILNIIGIIIWGVWYYEKAPQWGHTTGIKLAFLTFIILVVYTVCYTIVKNKKKGIIKKDINNETTPATYLTANFLLFIKEYLIMIPLTLSLSLFISIIDGFSIMDLFDNVVIGNIIMIVLLVILIITIIYFSTANIYKRIHCGVVKGRNNTIYVLLKCFYLLILFVPFFLMILNMFGNPTEANTIQKVFAGIYIGFYSIGFLMLFYACIKEYKQFITLIDNVNKYIDSKSENIINLIKKYENKEIGINQIKCELEKNE